MFLLLICLLAGLISDIEAVKCTLHLFPKSALLKKSLSSGAQRLGSAVVDVNECLSRCCENINCTDISYNKNKSKCFYYNCGVPNMCVQGPSTNVDFYHLANRIADKPKSKGVWARLLAEVSWQKRTTITFIVFSLLAVVGLFVLLIYVCGCCCSCCSNLKGNSGQLGRIRRGGRIGKRRFYQVLNNNDTDGQVFGEHEPAF